MQRSRAGKLQNCQLRTSGGGDGDCLAPGGETVGAGGQVRGGGGQGGGVGVDYDDGAAQLEGRQQLGRLVRS